MGPPVRTFCWFGEIDSVRSGIAFRRGLPVSSFTLTLTEHIAWPRGSQGDHLGFFGGGLQVLAGARGRGEKILEEMTK
jgi:hypothetical protein